MSAAATAIAVAGAGRRITARATTWRALAAVAGRRGVAAIAGCTVGGFGLTGGPVVGAGGLGWGLEIEGWFGAVVIATGVVVDLVTLVVGAVALSLGIESMSGLELCIWSRRGVCTFRRSATFASTSSLGTPVFDACALSSSFHNSSQYAAAAFASIISVSCSWRRRGSSLS